MANDNTFEIIDLPAGPQPLPRWVKGLHVNWMDGWSNAPHLIVKAAESPFDWPNKRFEFFAPNLYFARHTDGRGEAHYHGGAISEIEIEHRVRVSRDEWRTEKRKVLATTQQEGYAGRHFPIVLGGKHPLRGKTVLLRGPWHSSPPAGYQGVSVWSPPDGRWPAERRPWHQQTCCFGLILRDDLLIRIFARFQPHLRLACVGKTLQPLKPEWDAPKRWMLDRERDRFIAVRDSMMPPKAWAA